MRIKRQCQRRALKPFVTYSEQNSSDYIPDEDNFNLDVETEKMKEELRKTIIMNRIMERLLQRTMMNGFRSNDLKCKLENLSSGRNLVESSGFVIGDQLELSLENHNFCEVKVCLLFQNKKNVFSIFPKIKERVEHITDFHTLGAKEQLVMKIPTGKVPGIEKMNCVVVLVTTLDSVEEVMNIVNRRGDVKNSSKVAVARFQLVELESKSGSIL